MESGSGEVGRLVRSRRAALALTQTKLALLIGKDSQTVSNWERGHSRPQLGVVEELAKALQISIEDLTAAIRRDQSRQVNHLDESADEQREQPARPAKSRGGRRRK